MPNHRKKFGNLTPNRPIWEIANTVCKTLIPAHSSGFTYDPRQDSLIAYNQHALAVALERETSELKTPQKPTTLEVAKWISRRDRNLLLTCEGYYIGYWFDTDTALHYLDITMLVWDYDKALELADKFEQLSIFHPFTNTEIPIKPSNKDKETEPNPVPTTKEESEMPTHQTNLNQIWDGLKFAVQIPIIILCMVISLMIASRGILLVAKFFGIIFQLVTAV